MLAETTRHILIHTCMCIERCRQLLCCIVRKNTLYFASVSEAAGLVSVGGNTEPFGSALQRYDSMHVVTIYVSDINTVEPLNNGHIGMDHFVHYREVVLLWR